MDVLSLVKEGLDGDLSGKWLLVVDNADDLGSFYTIGGPRLADQLPQPSNASISMTTRAQKAGITFFGSANMLQFSDLSFIESEAMFSSKLEYAESGIEDFRELANEL